MQATRLTLAERLQSKLVERPNGCIEFTGYRMPRGYGRMGLDVPGKTGLTHRVAWELAHGPIPDGMHVCHRCDNPPCCNVDHLFLGTRSDNMRDMSSKGRAFRQAFTHCPQGHPYDDANTYRTPRGHRFCRTCMTARRRARRALAKTKE